MRNIIIHNWLVLWKQRLHDKSHNKQMPQTSTKEINEYAWIHGMAIHWKRCKRLKFDHSTKWYICTNQNLPSCCIAEKDNNTDVYKYNMSLFFSFYYPKDTDGLEQVRERVSKMAEVALTGADSMDLLWNICAFLLFWSKSLWSCNILDIHAISHSYISKFATFMLHMDVPSDIPPTKFIWHLYQEEHTCVLFILRNRCISRYFCFQCSTFF